MACNKLLYQSATQDSWKYAHLQENTDCFVLGKKITFYDSGIPSVSTGMFLFEEQKSP